MTRNKSLISTKYIQPWSRETKGVTFCYKFKLEKKNKKNDEMEMILSCWSIRRSWIIIITLNYTVRVRVRNGYGIHTI